MKIDDMLMGALIALGGAALLVYSLSLPTVAGMRFGPGLFPSIVGSGLLLCGSVIACQRLVRLVRAPGHRGLTIFHGPPGGDRSAYLSLMWPVAAGVFFALVLDPLGFLPTATISCAVLCIGFGLTVWRSLLVGVAAAFVVHLVFYSLLGVPLPWGVLTPVAW